MKLCQEIRTNKFLMRKGIKSKPKVSIVAKWKWKEQRFDKHKQSKTYFKGKLFELRAVSREHLCKFPSPSPSFKNKHENCVNKSIERVGENRRLTYLNKRKPGQLESSCAILFIFNDKNKRWGGERSLAYLFKLQPILRTFEYSPLSRVFRNFLKPRGLYCFYSLLLLILLSFRFFSISIFCLIWKSFLSNFNIHFWTFY